MEKNYLILFGFVMAIIIIKLIIAFLITNKLEEIILLKKADINVWGLMLFFEFLFWYCWCYYLGINNHCYSKLSS